MTCNGVNVGDHYLKVGQQVLVEVECLFAGGMVVCYKNSHSEAIRGALLQPPATDTFPPHLPCDGPLHRVPALSSCGGAGYECDSVPGRHLTVDIARSVWRPSQTFGYVSTENRRDTPSPGYISIGNRRDTPSPGYVSIGNRRNTLIRQLFGDDVSDDERYCKWRASCRQPVIVQQASTDPPHGHSNSHRAMCPRRRQAKIQARHKIRKVVAELNENVANPNRRIRTLTNHNLHGHYLRRKQQESAYYTTSNPLLAQRGRGGGRDLTPHPQRGWGRELTPHPQRGWERELTPHPQRGRGRSLPANIQSANVQKTPLKTKLMNLTIDLTKLSTKVCSGLIQVD